MDSSKKYDHPSPEETASPISKLFYVWILPLFKYGYKNDLQVKDLYNCAKPDLSGPLGDEMERIWDEEVKKTAKQNKKPSLLRTIRRTFIKSYSLISILVFLQFTILKMLQPIVLAEYIRYYSLEAEERYPEIGWGLAAGVIILAFLIIVFNHSCNLASQRIGMRCRIATCSLIYRKVRDEEIITVHQLREFASASALLGILQKLLSTIGTAEAVVVILVVSVHWNRAIKRTNYFEAKLQ